MDLFVCINDPKVVHEPVEFKSPTTPLIRRILIFDYHPTSMRVRTSSNQTCVVLYQSLSPHHRVAPRRPSLAWRISFQMGASLTVASWRTQRRSGRLGKARTTWTVTGKIQVKCTRAHWTHMHCTHTCTYTQSYTTSFVFDLLVRPAVTCRVITNPLTAQQNFLKLCS